MGRAVNAVLAPPQAERFALLVGVDPDRLVLNVNGWNKLVLLDPDRVFLFPRAAAAVEWFERELAAYQALAPLGAFTPWVHDYPGRPRSASRSAASRAGARRRQDSSRSSAIR